MTHKHRLFMSRYGFAAILFFAAIVVGACGAASVAAPAASTGSAPLAAAPGVVPTPEPTSALPPVAPKTVKAPPAAGKPGGPAWWPADLPMPTGVAFFGENKVAESTTEGTAIWQTQNTDLDGMRDALLKEATDAGYRVFTETMLLDAQRQVYFVKGSRAYSLSITDTDDQRTFLGNSVGIVQLTLSGSTTAVLQLPLGDGSGCYVDGCGFTLVSSVANVQCDGCEYGLSLLATDAFRGAGTYTNVQAVVKPGDEHSQPFISQDCKMTVTDQFSGTFECTGLKRAMDDADVLNAAGSWQLPN